MDDQLRWKLRSGDGLTVNCPVAQTSSFLSFLNMPVDVRQNTSKETRCVRNFSLVSINQVSGYFLSKA